ncbi:MAG: hypothetical protein ACRC1H_13435, partial [Caldilineaceae bacterium]
DDLPAWRQVDAKLLQHYQALGKLRTDHSYLRAGDWTTLVADGDIYVFLRQDESGAAVVAVNRGSEDTRVALDLSGHVPFGTAMQNPFGPGADSGKVAFDGSFDFELRNRWFSIWLTPNDVELTPPPAPTLEAVAGSNVVTLTVGEVSAPNRVFIYRSLVDGGYAEVASFGPEADGTAVFVDATVGNGQTVWYKAAVRDDLGRMSDRSNAVSALPSAAVLEATLGGPVAITHTISAITPTVPISGVVLVEGDTGSGPPAGLRAELGLLDEGAEEYRWTPGNWAADTEAGAVYTATLTPRVLGEGLYRWRFSTNEGQTWRESEPGTLSVVASDDTEAPKPPFRMDPIASTSQYLAFAWRVSRPRDLYNFRICRADLTAGEQGCALEVEAPRANNIYTDTQVLTGHTYSYTVRVVDTSFNVSEPSAAITMTAQLFETLVTFRVRVPTGTPPDDTIFIAGDNADVFGAPFNPALLPLTDVGDGIWEITLPIK